MTDRTPAEIAERIDALAEQQAEQAQRLLDTLREIADA